MGDDQLLVEACKKNDLTSFEKLYNKYASKMKGIAYRYANDSAVAEDIIQDAFIKVFTRIKSLENPNAFEGWLKRIVVNTAINYLNSLKKEQENISELNYVLKGVETPVMIEQEDYSMEELLEAIAQLPPGYRMVFNMYVIEGFSHKEIASELNISEGTSKSQLSKAKEFLKKVLSPQIQVKHER